MQKSALTDYLKQKYIKKGQEYTHTRIGNKANGIAGGTYHIDENDLPQFWDKYYKHVFTDNKLEFLTEKQLLEDGPIMIDIDLRYEPTVASRQHTKDHILDLVDLYFQNIEKMVTLTPCSIKVFVMEKPHVNKQPDKTKDGIHIIIGIKMHRALQMILRENIIKEAPEMWNDLPVTNTWENILDEGVTKGHTNWQVYGSRKPDNEAYILKYYYIASYSSDNEWSYQEKKPSQFINKENLPLLSAQYKNYPEFAINNNMQDQYEINKKNLTCKKKKYVLKQHNKKVPYYEIKNEKMLDEELEKLFEDIAPADYILKETHDYTMSLPEIFWGEGSYDKWIRTGWALANTDTRLFLTWIKFSSQSSEFIWDKIPELYQDWNAFSYKASSKLLTNRSIMYWSKEHAPNQYKKIHYETVDYYIEQTIQTDNPTEFDLACVLFQLFKDQFVCVSIKNNIWYEFKGHRWFEIDSGNTLRLFISKNVHDIYVKKIQQQMEAIQQLDQADSDYELIRKRGHKYTIIGECLKKTTWKNNIMREARELFYDKNFIQNIDNNPHLLCCNNCVIDIKNKLVRKGRPDDYISKCTLINYRPLTEADNPIVSEIRDFISQLFPIPELRNYMWEHLASCLVGSNENQTFTIYTGDGRNGKSKLVDLMGKVLGEYKGTVPITLITQKRNCIGSTSSEVVQLMGCRLAVMQEPSKGDKINEGIMKEITAGDPLQGRALFRDTVTFVPQFKLVVCTNVLFDINSNEDGTWRRIRKVDFMSKFLDNPYEDERKFPKSEYPYQFKIDKRLDTKYDTWAPVMLGLLVEKAFNTQGIVNDCNIVMASSDEYRDGQDYLAEFVKENIENKEGKWIKKMELIEHFSNWYKSHYGRAIPKGREIYSFMSKKYGPYIQKRGWRDVAIIYDGEEEDVLEEC